MEKEREIVIVIVIVTLAENFPLPDLASHASRYPQGNQISDICAGKLHAS